MLQMLSDRALADLKLSRDVGVRQAASDVSEHNPLAPGEPAFDEPLDSRPRGLSRSELRRDCRVGQCGAVDLDQVGPGAFEQVPLGIAVVARTAAEGDTHIERWQDL